MYLVPRTFFTEIHRLAILLMDGATFLQELGAQVDHIVCMEETHGILYPEMDMGSAQGHLQQILQKLALQLLMPQTLAVGQVLVHITTVFSNLIMEGATELVTSQPIRPCAERAAV